MGKHADLFRKCHTALVKLFTEIGREQGYSSHLPLITAEGLEQIAALMPRTNSDLLQADGMNVRKVELYGPRIMALLKDFWIQVDEREQSEIREQLNKLKSSSTVVGGFRDKPGESFDDGGRQSTPFMGWKTNQEEVVSAGKLSGSWKTNLGCKMARGRGFRCYRKKTAASSNKIVASPRQSRQVRGRCRAAKRGNAVKKKERISLNPMLFPNL
ncbi:hypothetical protein AB6A40_011056 [Gnathostoma spinigerum]|uniref:HRDC domain-containing protein n=1 Tax=Gnathostoma spinigerum TaxID=75299 RepID=A0ABD6F3I2_9BILA